MTCLCAIEDGSQNKTFLVVWYFGSGCTSHMCQDIGSFTETDRYKEKRMLNLDNSPRTEIEVKDTVSFAIVDQNGKKEVLTL